jgi:regulator of protease activity HflC (stomatin/prohibitin superfamily)
MQNWAAPVIGVVGFTLFILCLLSFDTLEYQEIGLNYSWISETIEDRTYNAGRYYIGIGNHFLKFPRVVNNMYFGDEFSQGTVINGPALQSRTQDGLTVRIEVSFQYKLKADSLYQMYQTFGDDYIMTLLRMAIEQLTTATTKHNAHDFFTNRTGLSLEMHTALDDHFQKHGYSEVPFFQLRTVRLPKDFEDSIQDTQVKEQEIKVAKAQQDQSRINYETTLLQAAQNVRVLNQQAAAQSSAIYAQNDAYCRQYRLTQTLQAEALVGVAKSAEWQPTELLEYLRIRAVRNHPSEKTTVRV